MSVTGPARPNLTAQLHERLSQERKEVEALTTAELKQLAASLSRVSTDALDIMKSDTVSRLDEMRRQMDVIERRQRRWPLWTALSSAVIALAVFALLWMATSWARSDLRAALSERAEARQALSKLREETHGITFLNTSDGTFATLPDGTETDWLCDDQPCLKLPE